MRANISLTNRKQSLKKERAKDKEQALIEKKTEEFLQKGNKIYYAKTGQTGLPATKLNKRQEAAKG